MAKTEGCRAVIYARFSSHNQREASIEDQVRACRKEAEDEVAELERQGIGNMYEVVLFFLEEMRESKMDAAVVAPMVSRMEVDREGNTHVEFALKDRTPVDNAAGVLIARTWLGH